MSNRAENGTRWIAGKLFVMRSIHRDKEYAKRIAQDLRDGKTSCGGGCPEGTEHYARVVRHNWRDHRLETEDGDEIDMNRWAVFSFPKESE